MKLGVIDKVERNIVRNKIARDLQIQSKGPILPGRCLQGVFLSWYVMLCDDALAQVLGAIWPQAKYGTLG